MKIFNSYIFRHRPAILWELDLHSSILEDSLKMAPRFRNMQEFDSCQESIL